MNKEYIPVEVAAASEIAHRYNKQQVVIICNDTVHNKTHFTTYGVSPADKVESANMAEFISVKIGCNPAERHYTEDFRKDFDAADYKATKESLGDAIRLLNSIIGAYNTSDDMAGQITFAREFVRQKENP